MDSLLSDSIAGETASKPRTVENWTRLEKQYKETIKTQSGILQYVVKEYQEKVADLEKEWDNWKKTAEDRARKGKGRGELDKEIAGLKKERDSWKKTTEDVHKMNAELAQQRNSLLDQKAELIKEEATIAGQLEILTSKLKQIEIDQKILEEKNQLLTVEKINFQQELSTKDREMTAMIENFERKLKTEADNSQRLVESLQSSEREVQSVRRFLNSSIKTNDELLTKQQELKEELAVLKREEALASCKICYDAPVQRVFRCGHAACNQCTSRIDVCHICRIWTGRNCKKIFLT